MMDNAPQNHAALRDAILRSAPWRARRRCASRGGLLWATFVPSCNAREKRTVALLFRIARRYRERATLRDSEKRNYETASSGFSPVNGGRLFICSSRGDYKHIGAGPPRGGPLGRIISGRDLRVGGGKFMAPPEKTEDTNGVDEK